jgi:hypothetical protein
MFAMSIDIDPALMTAREDVGILPTNRQILLMKQARNKASFDSTKLTEIIYGR